MGRLIKTKFELEYGLDLEVQGYYTPAEKPCFDIERPSPGYPAEIESIEAKINGIDIYEHLSKYMQDRILETLWNEV